MLLYVRINKRKPAFCICEKIKTQISCALTAKLISSFVFTTETVQSFNFLNPKFQACGCTARIVSDLARNREDRFSHDDAHTRMHSTYLHKKMSRVMRNPTFWLLTWSDTNQAVLNNYTKEISAKQVATQSDFLMDFLHLEL